jgi:hypothetical protein
MKLSDFLLLTDENLQPEFVDYLIESGLVIIYHRNFLKVYFAICNSAIRLQIWKSTEI